MRPSDSARAHVRHFSFALAFTLYHIVSLLVEVPQMIPTRFLSFIVVLAMLVAANSAIRADIITLADGTEHEGEVLKENGDSITLRVRIGTNVGSIVIPRREIVSIQTKSMAADTVLIEGVT